MRTRKRSSNICWPIVIGVVLAVVISILTAAVSAVLIDNESIQIGATPYVSFLVWFISGFTSAFCSGRTGEGNWLLRSGIATGIYCVILIAVGILLFDGVTNNLLYGLLATVVGFAVAVLVISRKLKAPNNRKMRRFKVK